MRNRLVVIIVGLLLVVAIGGGLAVYFLVLKPGSTPEPITYQVPEVFMTDLMSRGHIRVEMYLDLPDKRLTKEFDGRKIELIDAVYTVLRGKSRDDVSGTEGQESLREDLLVALRRLFGDENVNNLYFKQIVVD